MPRRRSPLDTARPNVHSRLDFRRRYDEVEARREELVTRLTALSEASRRHPGYRRAMRLLNETFRKERLTQRLAVLHAAAWLIDVLEKMHPIG